MRSAVFSISLLLFAAQGALCQVVNHRITDVDGSQQLLGALTEQGLSSPPFNQWYDKRVELYHPNKQTLENIDDLQDYEIEVFMGTWCGDSQREVPRLMKTLHELNFPDKQLSIVGVHRSRDQFKQSPGGEEAGKNIYRVPTIIFYRNGNEINRIVETPVVSIEQDIQTITSGGEYTPNYVVVARLHDLLESKGSSIVAGDAESVAQELKPAAGKSSELAGYGYVHLYQKNTDKAVAIFEVNRRLFPDEATVYEHLATAYYAQRNYDQAKENSEKALGLDPANKSALKMLAEIASK